MKYFLVGCCVFFGVFLVTHFSILLVCATIDVKVDAGIIIVDIIAAIFASVGYDMTVPKDNFFK